MSFDILHSIKDLICNLCVIYDQGVCVARTLFLFLLFSYMVGVYCLKNEMRLVIVEKMIYYAHKKSFDSVYWKYKYI